MIIPKLQTTWTTIPSDVTSSNWSVRLAQQQAALQRQRRFAQALARQRQEDQRRKDVRRNQATITSDNRTTVQRNQDQQQAVVKTAQIRKEQEKANNLQRFGQVTGATIKLTRPSTYMGYALTDKPFGEGFGNETANVAGDLLAAPLVSLTRQGFKYASDIIPRIAQFGVSNHTGNWTRFGNNIYRLKPGYAGMNSFQVERRALEAPPQEINITTGEVTPGVTPTRDGWEAVSMTDFNNQVRQNLGRDLNTEEIGRIMGDDLDIFSIRDLNTGEKLGFQGPVEHIATGRMRLNQYIDKNALRTRNLSQEGMQPYKLEDLVENGRLKGNVVLDESKPGSHGKNNWFNEDDDAMTRAQKYFRTKYDRPTREDMQRILDENPYNRSGVLISTGDMQYSIDSFKVALKNLEKNLRQGRNFAPLETTELYSIANNYGQGARYTEQFTQEFANMVKANKGIPEGIKTFKTKDGTLIFQQADGQVVGKLIPRSTQSIIDEYNPLIQALNDKFGLNIRQARIGKSGQIEWPNIYGVLYRNGGRLNNKNYAIH